MGGEQLGQQSVELLPLGGVEAVEQLVLDRVGVLLQVLEVLAAAGAANDDVAAPVGGVGPAVDVSLCLQAVEHVVTVEAEPPPEVRPAERPVLLQCCEDGESEPTQPGRRLHVLVRPGKRPWEIDEGDWGSAFVGLATAPVAVLRAFLPRMTAAGAYAVVVGGASARRRRRPEDDVRMTNLETFTRRNADFAAKRFTAGLRIVPSLKAFVVGCVDPRVDPADVLGTELGEAAVIRNVGGRVTPALVRELAMLREVTRSAGGDLGPGWDLVVLQHTDCGITRLADKPGLLAQFFEIDEAALPAKAVTDPRAAVSGDVAALVADPLVPAGFRISGLVYDVTTGLVETVVAP